MAGIEDLPDEMLLSIFSFLPASDLVQCAAVCQQFHSIVSGYTHLWKGKTYITLTRPADLHREHVALRALPLLREVSVEVENRFAVCVVFPRLVLSIADLGALERCPRLRCLCLSTRLNIAEHIMSSGSTIDFALLEKLEIVKTRPLDCRGPDFADADFLVSSALELCPNLTQLFVCAEILSAGLLEESAGIVRLRALGIECPTLERLSFLRRCSDALEELRLEGCAALQMGEVAELRHLRRLRRLRLHGCRVAEADMRLVVAALESLESLHLDQFHLVRDLSFLQPCGRLREVGVRFPPLEPPAHANGRVVRAPLYHITDELSSALLRLEGLGYERRCLDYLRPLLQCLQLRRVCLCFQWRSSRVAVSSQLVKINLRHPKERRRGSKY
ncbi:F-box/LRR-repeat protein 7-like [Schistocerca piceifrons]|uniref:F-box/LRR-repeat protein 7-like n=1 Tax=Schistocerca piceifrons TaxID=274613 RepID=UPI001F5F0AA0|nr:F-box/LRR-repeat protein 7-like [Schistocerca piceifrons]